MSAGGASAAAGVSDDLGTQHGALEGDRCMDRKRGEAEGYRRRE